MAVSILITLGTFIYDMFLARTKAENDDIVFWFISDKELTAIGDQLVTGLKLKPYQHDYENAWEWLNTCSEDGLLEFNISRNHGKRNSHINNPVRISILYLGNQDQEEICNVLGQRLAIFLSTDIKSGSIEYMTENEFRYVAEKVFTSDTE